MTERPTIHSMTAFAREEQRSDWGLLTWEVRTVNHRYLEIQTRLPEELRALDTGVRKQVSDKLKRGKVDCNLRFRPNPAVARGLSVDTDYLEQLLGACREVEQSLGTAASLNALDVLRWPGVIREEDQDIGPLLELALETLDRALDEIIQTRLREGAQIDGWIRQRCENIGGLVQQARKKLPEIQAGIHEKLLARLKEMNVEAEPGRLEQELVFQAQKSDVAEELDRIEGHLMEVRNVLKRPEAVGRRLDFLMQELHREANTFGAKSVDAETTKLSVELKVLIEQMREQVQNIE